MDPNATLQTWRDSTGSDAIDSACDLADWLNGGGFEPTWFDGERSIFVRYCRDCAIKFTRP